MQKCYGQLKVTKFSQREDRKYIIQIKEILDGDLNRYALVNQRTTYSLRVLKKKSKILTRRLQMSTVNCASLETTRTLLGKGTSRPGFYQLNYLKQLPLILLLMKNNLTFHCLRFVVEQKTGNNNESLVRSRRENVLQVL